MKSSQRLFVAFGLLMVLGLAVPAGAQKAKPDPAAKPAAKTEEPFGDTVNVGVVSVDVYVTDKKGNAVGGLTKNDFQIFENNHPVEVTNFYAVQGGKPTTPLETAQTAQTAPAEPPVPGAPPADAGPQTPEDQKLRLIVYIDNFNLKPFDRNRVMREIRAFIGQKLTHGDQLMLVTYDREMHIRRTFTSDPSLIASAMLDIEKISAQGVHGESDRRDALQHIADSGSVTEAEQYADTYAQSAFNDLSFSIDSLKKMVDALAGMPGRKAVLYVSDGLQMIAGQDVFYAVQNKYGEQTTTGTSSLEYNVANRLDELTAQANANRVTFYTIDAAGLRSYDSNSAENQGPGPQAAGLSQLVDQIHISNLQSTLQTLAEKTGGVCILNANVIMPQLEKIGTDFNTYYSLGYTPPHFGDGRYYKIDIKVKGRKDLVVRHREGYRDKSTESRMSDGTLAALNFPFEENPLGITLEFGQPRQRDDGFYLVPVLVRIPIGRLVLIPRETSEDAKVRLFIAALDDSGGTSEVQQASVPISIPKSDLTTAQKKQYVYSVTLLMRRGDQRVSIGARDDVGAQASFLSRGLRVGGS
ncbi:MAG TPA: VWA domain-containing protein [Thermoanaerobaculia bacterium]|jgi:VWFA-related protein|nr:VWA domain-containing protein [Thermoanaerobaculia bacterium]